MNNQTENKFFICDGKFLNVSNEILNLSFDETKQQALILRNELLKITKTKLELISCSGEILETVNKSDFYVSFNSKDFTIKGKDFKYNHNYNLNNIIRYIEDEIKNSYSLEKESFLYRELNKALSHLNIKRMNTAETYKNYVLFRIENNSIEYQILIYSNSDIKINFRINIRNEIINSDNYNQVIKGLQEEIKKAKENIKKIKEKVLNIKIPTSYKLI
jgi:hypothetical protein